MIKKLISKVLTGAVLVVIFGALQINLVPTSYAATAWENTLVAISDYAFNPSTIYVEAGDTVRWVNNGYATHTVTSDYPMFNSGSMFRGNYFSYTFTSAGTYYYHCSLHPNMRGIVVVSQPVYNPPVYNYTIYEPVIPPPLPYCPPTNCYLNSYPNWHKYPFQNPTYCCDPNCLKSAFDEYYQYSKQKNWQPHNEWVNAYPVKYLPPPAYYPNQDWWHAY